MLRHWTLQIHGRLNLFLHRMWKMNEFGVIDSLCSIFYINYISKETTILIQDCNLISTEWHDAKWYKSINSNRTISQTKTANSRSNFQLHLLLDKCVISKWKVCAFCLQGICTLPYTLYGHTEIVGKSEETHLLQRLLDDSQSGKTCETWANNYRERPTWQCDVVVVVVVSVTAVAAAVVVVTVIVVYLVLAFSVNAK